MPGCKRRTLHGSAFGFYPAESASKCSKYRWNSPVLTIKWFLALSILPDRKLLHRWDFFPGPFGFIETKHLDTALVQIIITKTFFQTAELVSSRRMWKLFFQIKVIFFLVLSHGESMHHHPVKLAVQNGRHVLFPTTTTTTTTAEKLIIGVKHCLTIEYKYNSF